MLKSASNFISRLFFSSVFIFFILSLVLVSFAPSVNAETSNVIPEFHSRFGKVARTPGDIQFQSVRDVAASPDDTKLYILDSSSSTVQIINANDYSFISKFGTPSGEYGCADGDNPLIDGYLCSPSKVITDSSGNVFIADSGNARIQKFDSNGNFIFTFGSLGLGGGAATPGTFSDTSGIAIDSQNNIYVVNQYNHRVDKFDSAGTFIRTVGGWGPSDGNFRYPKDVAIDGEDNIWVIDERNGNQVRIKQFDSNGTPLSAFGGYGTGDGQFEYPLSIKIASNGNIYIADSTSNRVQVFSQTGTYLNQFGSTGNTDGLLRGPSGISFSPDGAKLYVADSTNNRIQAYNTANNTYINQFGEYGYPGYVPPPGSSNGELNQPRGSVLSEDGTKLYVVDSNNNRIQIFNTADNSFLGQFGGNSCYYYEDDLVATDGNFCEADGLAISKDGTKLYVADTGNSRIQVFSTANNTYLTQFGSESCSDEDTPTDGNFCYPKALTISPDGTKLYVSDTENSRIQIFNVSDNTFSGKFGIFGTGNGQLRRPSGLTFSPDGTKLYVADTSNNRIQIFNTTDNSYASKFGTSGSADGRMSRPEGTLFSKDGTKLYVADTNNNRIQIFNASDNEFVDKFGSLGAEDGELYGPAVLNLSADGTKFYISDTYSGQIQEYRFPTAQEEGTNQQALPNSENQKTVLLQTPETTNITCYNSLKETDQTKKDQDFKYPLGLVEFCFDTEQANNQVVLTFVTDLKPEQVTARKYNPITNTYFDVAGASITQSTYQNQAALKLTYIIADNGPLDIDPAVGVIKDPVGLAVTNQLASDLGLASTGTNNVQILIIATSVIAVSVVALRRRFKLS